MTSASSYSNTVTQSSTIKNVIQLGLHVRLGVSQLKLIKGEKAIGNILKLSAASRKSSILGVKQLCIAIKSANMIVLKL